MTKRLDLRLSREPINMQPEAKETPAERLTKLHHLLQEEKNCANPCAVYIEDLNMSIEFLKERNTNG